MTRSALYADCGGEARSPQFTSQEAVAAIQRKDHSSPVQSGDDEGEYSEGTSWAGPGVRTMLWAARAWILSEFSTTPVGQGFFLTFYR